MHRTRIFTFLLSVCFLVPLPASAQPTPAASSHSVAPSAKCEHGVKTTLCTRCNPKLEGVFKARNDWCAEHSRSESQCVICHPDLSKEGIK